MLSVPGNRERRIWPLLIAAVFLASLVMCARPAGIKVAIDEAGVSIEMNAVFFEVAFDFGQVRSKMNSLQVLAR